MTTAGGANRKQYDHLIKLIIIGDSSVGKSCILLRFSEDHFPTSHMPTIGKLFFFTLENCRVIRGRASYIHKRFILSNDIFHVCNRWLTGRFSLQELILR